MTESTAAQRASKQADKDAIRPFQANFPETELTELRRRACGPHTSESSNAREKGRSCPKAWVFPVPECVGLKVSANPHKSPSSSSDEEGWKRGRNAQNPRGFSPGSRQIDKVILLPA